MASTTSVASTSTTLTQESMPQAGPIPSKRGEIGFIEGVHEQVQEPSQMTDQVPLPARHPADSHIPIPFQDPVNEARYSDALQTLSDSSSMTIVGKRRLSEHKRLPIFMGIGFTTLVLLGAQLLVFVGTLIGWVFAALALSSGGTPQIPSADLVNNEDISQDDDSGPSRVVFVHLTFVIFVLTQIIFIERGIFRARTERHAFKNPSEMPPTSLQHGHSGLNNSMLVTPWICPPLPTYAAALTSSGACTGDVEDVEIARPPPPAYNKTRGSTLILASYLPENLHAREYEQDRRASGTSVCSDCPISFVSLDEEWEARKFEDADRARRIEETENDPLRRGYEEHWRTDLGRSEVEAGLR